ncbi:MAG: DUF4386 domain-containing protein [Spirochaetaceae bacterium]|jgi:hypothetical protein|nr:DUF4386 domain-containing protein [Spirochaetaceae bacterium]
MDEYRKTGIIIGVLYIIGTISGVLSAFLTGTVNNLNEYFVQIVSSKNIYILGTIFILCMGFSLAFIPIILYPILKRQNKIFALGYVVFRGAIETVTYIAIFGCMVLLLKIGQNYVVLMDPEKQQFINMGILIVNFRQIITNSTLFVFSIGAFIFYGILYKSKLIPVWLSIWGIIAIILHITTGILILFELQTETSMINSIMNFPIFLQEMVMAIWLIIKGFNKETNKKI